MSGASDKRIILATTYTYDEVRSFLALIAALDAGRDVSIIMRRPAIASMRRKCQKLEAKYKALNGKN